MAKKPLPTPDTLRQHLHYDAETGSLTWRARTPEMFSGWAPEQNCQQWNARFAGREVGRLTTDGAGQFGFYGQPILSHRAAWAITHGKWPDGVIDHINGDPADNRLANLRDVDVSTNLRNMKMSTQNTSGASGVMWNKYNQVWHARVKAKGRVVLSKYFKDFEEAKRAVAAVREAHGFTKRHGH